MSHIADNFSFVSNSQPRCAIYLENCMQLAEILHVPVKAPKTVHPSTTVTLHGVEVDSYGKLLWKATLPDDKVNSPLETVECLRNAFYMWSQIQVIWFVCFLHII